MYKCSECGMEYEIKPDYCDCGNDEFVIVAEKKEPAVKKEPARPVEEKIPEKKESVEVEKVYRSKIELPKVDPISLTIFLVCLILAIIVLLIPVKQNEIIEAIANNEPVSAKNIPAIDKFWNNSIPVTEEKPPVSEKTVVKTEVPAKTASTKVSKPVQTKKTTTTQTSVKQTKTTSSVSTADQAKKAEEARKKAEEEAKRKAEENARKLAEVQKHAEELQQSMSAEMEYSNYKAALRNMLGSKIDFARVIGDGDCIISFKIDQNGKLINGAFAKQSSNMTLNDAVYKAFMSSRNFNPPPRGYKNETLKLYVKFYNGNFEISLN